MHLLINALVYGPYFVRSQCTNNGNNDNRQKSGFWQLDQASCAIDLVMTWAMSASRHTALLSRLRGYGDLMLQWNARINLTSRKRSKQEVTALLSFYVDNHLKQHLSLGS